MASNKENKGENNPQDISPKDLEKLGQRRDDMLNLEKAAQEMDSISGIVPKVEGSSISGSGSGPGTGETSDDFARPYSESGTAKNDYVSHEPLPKDINQPNAERVDMEKKFADKRNDPEGAHEKGSGPSGFPGGGAARDVNDKIPSPENKNEQGWTPESPAQEPKTNDKKASR